jgi:hypothetical protein
MAEKKEKPVNKNVTTKIATREKDNDSIVVNVIVRYCS